MKMHDSIKTMLLTGADLFKEDVLRIGTDRENEVTGAGSRLLRIGMEALVDERDFLERQKNRLEESRKILDESLNMLSSKISTLSAETKLPETAHQGNPIDSHERRGRRRDGVPTAWTFILSILASGPATVADMVRKAEESGLPITRHNIWVILSKKSKKGLLGRNGSLWVLPGMEVSA